MVDVNTSMDAEGGPDDAEVKDLLRLWRAVVYTYFEDADDLLRKAQREMESVDFSAPAKALDTGKSLPIPVQRTLMVLFDIERLLGQMEGEDFKTVCDNGKVDPKAVSRRVKECLYPALERLWTPWWNEVRRINSKNHARGLRLDYSMLRPARRNVTGN